MYNFPRNSSIEINIFLRKNKKFKSKKINYNTMSILEKNLKVNNNNNNLYK